MKDNKIEKILNKGVKIKIPDKLEKRNLVIIDKLSQKENFYKNNKIIPIIFRPIYAFPAITIFIIIPIIIFLITPAINKINYINYRGINEDKMNSIIIENQIKNLKESDKIDEVKNASLKKQNKNIIINWENPINPIFKEVVIERHNNKEKLIIYKGNNNNYIDLNASSNVVYYLIKVITKENEISIGIKVYL